MDSRQSVHDASCQCERGSMKTEKIIEIAHETVRLTWINDSPEDLIAFAHAIIEAQRDTTTIEVPTVVWDKLKDVNTVKDLIRALEAAEEE